MTVMVWCSLAHPSLVEEAKLSQVLDKVHQIIAHPVTAVVLPQLREGELEEESETLHQQHSTPPGRHGVEVLQHEEPDLAGSLHQEELEAGPGDDFLLLINRQRCNTSTSGEASQLTRSSDS